MVGQIFIIRKYNTPWFLDDDDDDDDDDDQKLLVPMP